MTVFNRTRLIGLVFLLFRKNAINKMHGRFSLAVHFIFI